MRRYLVLASDETMYDRFGCALSLTDRWAVVGAEGQRTNVAEGGAAYVFDLKAE